MKLLLSPCFAWHEQGMDADGLVLEWMWPLLHTDANEWKNCWMWLFEVAWLVGLLIIKSCIDLICSLLMLKQLIISNPMTHLLLKWNMFKRSLFHLCIICLAIYAVRWQLTDFVYSPLMFWSQMCTHYFSLDVCMINSNLNSKWLFVKVLSSKWNFSFKTLAIHFIAHYLKCYLCNFLILKLLYNEIRSTKSSVKRNMDSSWP